MTSHAATSIARDVGSQRGRPDLEGAQVLVEDWRGLAVHHAAGRAHHGAPENLPDALVAHADAEQREVGPQLAHCLQRDARVLRLACSAPSDFSLDRFTLTCFSKAFALFHVWPRRCQASTFVGAALQVQADVL